MNLNKPVVHCFAGCGISGTYEHAIAMIEGDESGETRRTISDTRASGQSRNVVHPDQLQLFHPVFYSTSAISLRSEWSTYEAVEFHRPQSPSGSLGGIG